METLDACLAQLRTAIEKDDPGTALNVGMALLGGFLRDVKQIRLTLERIAERQG